MDGILSRQRVWKEGKSSCWGIQEDSPQKKVFVKIRGEVVGKGVEKRGWGKNGFSKGEYQ